MRVYRCGNCDPLLPFRQPSLKTTEQLRNEKNYSYLHSNCYYYYAQVCCILCDDLGKRRGERRRPIKRPPLEYTLGLLLLLCKEHSSKELHSWTQQVGTGDSGRRGRMRRLGVPCVRLCVLKVGTVVRRRRRSVQFHFGDSGAYPFFLRFVLETVIPGGCARKCEKLLPFAACAISKCKL